MSSIAAAPLRLVAFGDLEGSVWGAAIDAGQPAIVFGAATVSEAVAGAENLRFAAEGDRWRLTGPGFDLLVVPPETPETEPEPGAGGDELCAITGTITVAGTEQTIDCLGTRSTDPNFEPAGLESLRAVAGWFGPDRCVALRAQRPQRARGQEDDRIEATLFEPDGRIAVSDPRLSTTYTAGGRPSRTSLELWIDVGEDQYPRRAAAEALGAGAAAQGDRMSLQVTPLRCHTAGLDGAGVYLLARF